MGSNNYGRTSKKWAHRTEYIDLYRKDKIDKIFENKTHYIYTILDSSLITQTPYQIYNTKLVQCGNYIYSYSYESKKKKKVKDIKTVNDKRKDIKKELMLIEKKMIKTEENENKENKLKNKNEIKKENKTIKIKELKKIDTKNINRSKYNLQMLIKTNEDIFKTFITLTFKDEITDIREANKKFNIFKTAMKRSYKDFTYISVPEFQKNGRIHYHLLTNIDYNDVKLINENISYCNLLSEMRGKSYKLFRFSSFKDRDTKFFFFKDEVEKSTSKSLFKCTTILKPIKIRKVNSWCFDKQNPKINLASTKKQTSNKGDKIGVNDLLIVLRRQDNKLQNTKKTFSYKSKSFKVFKTLKYWNYGFSNIISIENINIVAYLTKYLTKDIDNRLFSFRRYTYSLNLKKPSITYLNLDRMRDFARYVNLVVNYDSIYNYSYSTVYNDNINFTEYKIKNLVEA